MAYNPDFHSGGEGYVLYAGVRYDVTNVTARESVTVVPVTTTGDYDTVEKMTYARKKATQADLSGQFDMPWNANQAPMPALRPRVEGEMFVQFPDGAKLHLISALIESADLQTGGPAGVYSGSWNYSNQGKFEWL